VGLVAASLPDGARVVVPDVEFTSTLFPFLVQEGRGVTVRTVAPSALADALDDETDLVAFSAVQMSSGEVADLAGVVEAARRHGVQTLCDATQAAGWLPLRAGDFDFLVCAAYKWLMAPRGTVFMTVREERLLDVVPHAAGWYAGEDVHTTYFGPPLRLAHDARRLDVSPIWFSWVGTAPALEVIERIGVEAIQRHDLALANAFRAGLGMPDEPSAIVVSDFAGDLAQLEAAGVMAAIRGGRLRTSWHVYNTADDVEAALRAIAS
jgi:selenocysteine lyase/cysteine desulfurase